MQCYKCFIYNFALYFITLFISLIPSRASAQIEDGEIYASINQKDGMVCFHDNPEKYNNPAMLHKIDQEVGMFGSIFSDVLFWGLMIVFCMNPNSIFNYVKVVV